MTLNFLKIYYDEYDYLCSVNFVKQQHVNF